MKIFIRLVVIFITIALAQYPSTTDSTIVTKKNLNSIKDTNISLRRLKPIPPIILVKSAEISDEIDQQNAASKAKK